MRVAALIPAYCEEPFIADVVARTRAQLSELLVVDDGSTDRTVELARGAGAEVIVHAVNQGKGMALQTGMRTLVERGVDFVLILDADGQHLPEEIPRFLAAAERRPDWRMIVGNRMEEAKDMPWNRLYTNRFMSGQISLLCGQDIPDTQCGFRLIHRDLVPRLLTGDKAGRFDYETEMLILTAWAGEKIGAVPVSTVYGEETSSIHPLRDTARFFKLMGRYWMQRARGEGRD